MKLAIKLAFRNLLGAGLRTWLNVIVLSFSFVIIIWAKGILTGWDHQAKHDMTLWEVGGGQYWNEKYDPFDPFTLSESHGKIPEVFDSLIIKGDLIPILIVQGTIYPQGRMQSIMVKGINPHQNILALPTGNLDTALSAIPAIIGNSMARANKLKAGDYVTLQWRDANGTFDAAEIYITEIFSTNVPSVDASQIWIPLSSLQEMTLFEDEATIVTFRDGAFKPIEISGWIPKTHKDLFADVEQMIKTKSVGQSVFYIILLLLAMLAIFDTQILSIFRRQKEIGTYIALGYTRQEVVGLFTVEGAMHAVFATVVAGIYGIPFLIWQAKTGWAMPVDASELGMAISQTLYPVFTLGLVLSTIVLILLTTIVVSYWPSRKIAKMNPTEALRGKLQ